MTKSNLFDMIHSSHQETALAFQVAQQFIADNNGDFLLERVMLALDTTINPKRNVINKIKSYFIQSEMKMPFDQHTVVITGLFKEARFPVLVWMWIDDYENVCKYKIDITAAPKVLDEVIALINADFLNKCLPVIKWWFIGRHGDDTREFYLPPTKEQILKEYYPYLDDPEQYLEDYMRSKESVLLIEGPPGTGKTTLLRHLITKYKLSAHVIYDERLMDRDGPFQSFLFGDGDGRPALTENPEFAGGDIMIVEDADAILASRERDGNRLMARFLNISDGLIKVPNKKMVFTTNVIDFQKVDDALIRPGRCFGIMHTRLLNFTEAQAAAKAGGLKAPVKKPDPIYSLAELFNEGKTTEIRKVGFGVRH